MLDTPVLIGIQLNPSPGTATGQDFVQQLGLSDWLGPLAPIALSPFFGLALLSGIATYGPEWIQERSAMFQADGALDSPSLFWTMAALALFTSLPRLTKVSKPLGLAAEKLETSSAIIILIAVRLLGSQFQADLGTSQIASEQLFLSAGFGVVSLNVALSAVAALNVVVINMVKLFCEFLIWLIPVPAIDAMIEAGNKSICAGLMGLYCYSPGLATGLNLLLLLICLLIFGWIYRRLKCYQETIAGPALAWLLPNWFAQRGTQFTAFVDDSPHGVPRYSRVEVSQSGPDYYDVTGRRWLRSYHWRLRASAQQARSNGWILQSLTLQDDQQRTYLLLHRRWVSGDTLYTGNPTPSIVGG
ncbi:MAG TPA: hypothetical protein DCF63_18375 [Planctomycetaceae bacterium]|nr:hypothetical protein [Planctomycetaceae bacterium]